MVALFDHEEVGSDSAQGAGSPAMFDSLTRITQSFATNSSKVKNIWINHVSLYLLGNHSNPCKLYELKHFASGIARMMSRNLMK